jgi:hypothetical protein
MTNGKIERGLDVRAPFCNGQRIQKLQALVVNPNHKIEFSDHGDDKDAVVVVIVDAIKQKNFLCKIQTSGAPSQLWAHTAFGRSICWSFSILGKKQLQHLPACAFRKCKLFLFLRVIFQQ